MHTLKNGHKFALLFRRKYFNNCTRKLICGNKTKKERFLYFRNSSVDYNLIDEFMKL